MQNKKVEFLDWGMMRYQEAWDQQELILKSSAGLKLKIRNKEVEDQPVPNYLIFCEHPHVYTLGKSGHIENLLLSEAELANLGIDFHKINRGGDITYHGPGQIVGYPIIDLESFQPDLHEYLRKLEEACIQTIAEYGIEGSRIDGLTGVWVDAKGKDPRKIMAIGVRCVRWITMHGFAFNVNSDLSYFDNIIPCGINDKGVTSLHKELGRTLDMQEVKQKMKNHLADLFGFAMDQV